MGGMHLSRLPLSAKLFCTLFLAGIGCGALAAFAQASTAVGISPSAVEASLAPEMPMTGLRHGQMSAEKEIDLGQIPAAADRAWIRTPLLIQTSHTHLFGQTLIAGLLALIFAFSGRRESVKCAVGALPFAGTLIDIGGMWATRFLSPSLSVLVIAGGSLFALGYVLIALLSLHELWFRKESLA
ncbi:MAG: hypothetical protein ACXWLR_03905 [Myxococcales bacterium]